MSAITPSKRKIEPSQTQNSIPSVSKNTFSLSAQVITQPNLDSATFDEAVRRATAISNLQHVLSKPYVKASLNSINDHISIGSFDCAYIELEKLSRLEDLSFSSEFYALQGHCLDNLKQYGPALLNYNMAANAESDPKKKAEFSKKAAELEVKIKNSTPPIIPKATSDKAKKPKKSTPKLSPIEKQAKMIDEYLAELSTAQNLYDQDKVSEAIAFLNNMRTTVGLLAGNLKSHKSAYFTLMGDCFQKAGDHRSAIINYNTAERFEVNPCKKAKLSYKLANSQRAIKQYANANWIIDRALGLPNIDPEQRNRFIELKAQADALCSNEIKAQGVDTQPIYVENNQFSEQQIDNPFGDDDQNPDKAQGFDTQPIYAENNQFLELQIDNPFGNDGQNPDFVIPLANSVEKVARQNSLFSPNTPPPFIQLPQFAHPENLELTTTTTSDGHIEQMPAQNPASASPKEVAKSIDPSKLKLAPTDKSEHLIQFVEPNSTALLSTEAASQAQMFLKEGRDCFNSDELQKAVDCFEAGINFIDLANDPQLSMELFYLLGTAQLQLRNIKECKTAWQKCIPLIDKDLIFKAHLIRSLAILYVQDNEFDAAEKLFQEAINTKFPGDEKNALILCLADLFIQKADTVQNYRLFYLIGTAQLQLGKIEECKTAWLQCIPLIDKDLTFKAHLIRLLAMLYVRENKFPAAEKLLQQAINTKFPSDEKGALILCLADLFIKKMDTIKCHNLLSSALEQQPTFSDEINLEFCTRLIRISGETKDHQLYNKLQGSASRFTQATAEAQIRFLFATAAALEMLGRCSDAMKVYQFLLNNISGEKKEEVANRLAILKNQKNA